MLSWNPPRVSQKRFPLSRTTLVKRNSIEKPNLLLETLNLPQDQMPFNWRLKPKGSVKLIISRDLYSHRCQHLVKEQAWSHLQVVWVWTDLIEVELMQSKRKTNSRRSWTGAPLDWWLRTELWSWTRRPCNLEPFWTILPQLELELFLIKKRRRKQTSNLWQSTISEKECSKRKNRRPYRKTYRWKSL